MNPSLEEAIKEAYAIAPSNKVILHTLEIRQEGVQDSLYLVQSLRPIIATDENGVERAFTASGFQFSLPPSTEEGFQSLNVAVDNIGRQATDFVNKAQSAKVPVKLIYRPYLSDDLSGPQMNPPLVLWIKDVKINAMQVTATATFMDLVNKKFPLELYSRERFPTLG